MRYNKWIKDIKRIRVARKQKKEKLRCDFAERWINFEKDFFEKFKNDLNQEDFITYPSYQDYEDLKSRIALLNNVNLENVYMTTGSGSCIKDLIQVTCKKDSEIISSSPCFPMYFIFGETFGAKFNKISYQETGSFKLDKYLELINENTRLAILTNPNSPYGDFRPVSEIEELCIKLKEKNIILLIDEAYIDFAPKSSVNLIKKHDNIIISKTFSKAWGAAGTRVGYMIANKKIINLLSNIQLTYPITGPSLKFINHLLDNTESIKDYVHATIQSRDKLCDLLEANNYDVLRSHTNSIHFHEKKGDNQKSIKSLEDHGVAFKCGAKLTGTMVTVPLDDRKTWIRLSVGPGIENSKFILNMISNNK